MLPILLSALLLISQDPSPAKQDGPDSARVKTCVEQLEKAFKSDVAKDKCAAIEAAVGVVDSAVIERIAKGLREKDQPTVRRASIEALRQMRHPKALAALLDFAKQDKDMRKDEDVYPYVLRAIGQHGDPKTIALLSDGALGPQPFKVDRARILALGNIRSRESVEALLDLMHTLGKHKVQPYMDELSLSLCVLTGAEEGTLDGWQRWWNDNKKSLKVSAELPEIPKHKEARWKEYWGISDKTGPKTDKAKNSDKDKGKDGKKDGESQS